MQEGPPEDPADHAEDFSYRHAPEMDRLSGQRMRELGIPETNVGSHIPTKGHFVFVPDERAGGGNDPHGGLTIDSGVFNPALLGTLAGGKEWAKGRVRDRLDAIIAHEREESLAGGDHEEAVKRAPDTGLPIREGARRILRAIRGDEEPE